MTFLIAEVHPFVDGNGRLARVMMNAELIAGGQQRIIIATGDLERAQAFREPSQGRLRSP